MFRLMTSVLVLLLGSLPAYTAGIPGAPRTFSPPTGLDSLLDANPLPLPEVKPADHKDAESPVPQPPKGEPETPDSALAFFHVQLDALSDMDAAQARKTALEQSLGEKIYVVFDPPYYKLRLGNFASKREAEDALVDLAEKNIQGFVIKR